MATIPHIVEEHRESDVDLNRIDWSNAKLPGYTIDEFLERGDQEGARREFARLIQEGLDSGPAKPMGDNWVEETVARVRARAAKRA